MASTRVACVKQKSLLDRGYSDLRAWLADEANVYVGRNMRIFIKKEIFHVPGSPWASPFPVDKPKAPRAGPLPVVLEKYRRYIQTTPVFASLSQLRGKTLGCWCTDDPESDLVCHAQILVQLLGEKEYPSPPIPPGYIYPSPPPAFPSPPEEKEYRHFIIRHAPAGTAGKWDPPVTEPLTLPEYGSFGAVVTSPYVAARATAGKWGVPVYVDSRLSEFQGNKNRKKTPFELDPETQVYGPIPDTLETPAQARARLASFYADLQAWSLDLLVVTHGSCVKILREIAGSPSSTGVPYLKGFGIVHTPLEEA